MGLAHHGVHAVDHALAERSPGPGEDAGQGHRRQLGDTDPRDHDRVDHPHRHLTDLREDDRRRQAEKNAQLAPRARHAVGCGTRVGVGVLFGDSSERSAGPLRSDIAVSS